MYGGGTVAVLYYYTMSPSVLDSASRICYLLENGKQASGRSVKLCVDRPYRHAQLLELLVPVTPQVLDLTRISVSEVSRYNSPKRGRKMGRRRCIASSHVLVVHPGRAAEAVSFPCLPDAFHRVMRRRRPTISIGDGVGQWEYENMGNE